MRRTWPGPLVDVDVRRVGDLLEADLQYAVVERGVGAVLVDAGGKPNPLAELPLASCLDCQRLAVALERDGLLARSGEVGDESKLFAIVKNIDVAVGAAGGVRRGTAHHALDLVEDVPERVVAVVPSHKFG